MEGRITTRSWEDKETKEKKYRTEIMANRVQFGEKSRAKKQQEEEGAEKEV